ncbi:hypothetical protein JCM10212_000512 [Sporobolomyces blumeae]
MDSESFYIITLFQQGSYRSAISAYDELSSPSPLLTLYAARSHLALSPPSPASASTLLRSLPHETLDSRAIECLAKYLEGGRDDDLDKKEQAVGDLEEILAETGERGLTDDDHAEGRFVRGVVGTVWILEGDDRREEGIEVLREAVELGKDQECLAILSHLYISLHLSPLSSTLLGSPSVQSFTLDSLLSQLLVARTSLATGPKAKYQEAYYVYEELRSMQGGRGEATLAGVGVSQACLGRWQEADEAVKEALEMNPQHPTTLANSVALAVHTGKPRSSVEESLRTLAQADPRHPLIVDLEAKERLFDEAASRFGVTSAAAAA